MQQALRTKLLIGILAALVAIGVVLANQLRVNQQTADAAAKLAAERDKAAQIDRDDKAAIEKIRQRNAQQSSKVPNQ
jgi:Flp pilus assembly protein TadG